MASGRATICSRTLRTDSSTLWPQESHSTRAGLRNRSRVGPRNRSSPEPHTGQTMRPGLDVTCDETFTLASFAGRGLLLIEPTLVLRRHRGVTGSVTGGEVRQRRPPRARTRGARISFVITVCGPWPQVRAADEGPSGSFASRPHLRSLRRASPRSGPPGKRHRWLLRVLRAARIPLLLPPISARAHPAGRSPALGCWPLAGAPAPHLSDRPIRRAPRAS